MSNSPDPFDFVKQLWGQMAVPGYGLTGTGAGPAQMPSFDPKELEKRLAELKQVKQWLEMNLNMMGLQINTIEMQLAAMNGLSAAASRAFDRSPDETVGGSHSPAGAGAGAGSGAPLAPWMDSQTWLNFLKQQAEATQKAMHDGAKAMQKAAPPAAPSPSHGRPPPAKRAPRKKKT